jgi:hypothetical protein
MFLNYGDLGVAVKELVETYSKNAEGNRKIDTIGRIIIRSY